jgi:CDP-paratose 2-epimerase
MLVTGPMNSGVELHGFLSYLVRCNLESRRYRVYGCKGKQCATMSTAWMSCAQFIHGFVRNPRSGQVYNIGGAKGNACSIIEALELCEQLTGRKMLWDYADQNRTGLPFAWNRSSARGCIEAASIFGFER